MRRIIRVLLFFCTAPIGGEIGRAQATRLLQPVNLGKVNTDQDEDCPHLASSGLTLYYASRHATGFRIMAATRKAVNVPWGAGKAQEDLLDQGEDVRDVFLTPEGKYPQYLYFAGKENPAKAPERSDNFDLFFLIKQSAKADFTTPTPVQAVCTEAGERHPWLSGDGQYLYFSRRQEQGWQVFVSSRPAGGGAWGARKRVELPLDFHHATLTPDGKTMYLQGPLGEGRWGLFRATVKSLTTCSEPLPLTELNHPEGKMGTVAPNLSRSGVNLYFASDRPGGKGRLDLWVVPVAQLRK